MPHHSIYFFNSQVRRGERHGRGQVYFLYYGGVGIFGVIDVGIHAEKPESKEGGSRHIKEVNVGECAEVAEQCSHCEQGHGVAVQSLAAGGDGGADGGE